jgi:putative addiction module component (TIGR02574 family)
MRVSKMVVAMEKLKAELVALSERERADLALFLLNSLEDANAESDPDVEAAWDTELARRTEEIRDGSVRGIPAEQVFAGLREKYS